MSRSARSRVEVDLPPCVPPAVVVPWSETREGPVDERSARGNDGRRAAPRHILLAGVGYRNLRDMSAGPALVERLAGREWPDGVDVEDLSFGAVHAVHWLQAREPYAVAIFFAAVPRGRAPATVHLARWNAPTVSAEEVQARVAEAVTGVIGLDTLLTVLAYFGALPPRVYVLEIEPQDQEWGPEVSLPVQSALDEAEALIRRQLQVLLG